MIGFIERLLSGLEAEWRASSLSISHAHVHTAIRATLATLLALILALWLHLDNPWWAAITGFVIGQSHATTTFVRSFDRAIGTLTGAVAGYMGAALISHHFMFELACAVVTAFSIYGVERAEHGYAYLLGGVTAVLVMFGSLNTPDAAIDIAIYRTLEVLIGIMAACLVDYVLAERVRKQDKQSRKPGLFSRPINRELAVTAISGGVAVAIIPTIWESLQLPSLGQVPITAVIILTSIQSEPHWKAMTRAAGCLIGAFYGLLSMWLAGDAMLPWLALMAIGLFISAQIYHRGGDGAYIGLQAGVAIILAMVQGLGPSPDILPAIDRLAGIFGGIVVVGISQPLLAPLVRWVLDRYWNPNMA